MKTILLIEPDVKLGKTYATALGRAGYEVLLAATAQDAIVMADTANAGHSGPAIDLVILELHLVGHSGIEFLYEFRTYPEWREVPVVILSHAPPSELVASHKVLRQQLGIVKHLYKPETSLRSLVASVDAVTATVPPS